MNRQRSEYLLRGAFVVATLIILGISSFQLRTDDKEYLGRSLRLTAATAAAETAVWPHPDDGVGILTYIFRNYKRWKAEIKKNPLKWLHMKQKLKRFLSVEGNKSSNKLDDSKQKRYSTQLKGKNDG